MTLLARLCLKCFAVLTAIFALSIALIRAQPYDDSELRAFLLPPEGCPAPCWQGIRPGETYAADVMTLLKKHPWVHSVHHENYSTFSNGYIRWQWSALRPSMIDENDPTNLWFDDSTTQNFHMLTDIRFGDLWLILGTPDGFLFNQIHESIKVSIIYHDQVMLVVVDILCSRPLTRLWRARTDIVWLKEIPDTLAAGFANPRNIRTVCR